MPGLSRPASPVAMAGARVVPQDGDRNGTSTRHYVLVHGAWHGGWAWCRTAPLLRAAGHSVSVPTLSGLGERWQVAAGSCGLHVHVRDIVDHLMMEDLNKVVLVGHSYAGCVLSGVLGERTGRVAHAIYLDALVPMQGQALASFVPPAVKTEYERLAAQDALVAPRPPEQWGELWGIADPALVDWVTPRIKPQAARSFTETVLGDPMAEPVRRSYLKCARNPHPLFKDIADGIRKDARFQYAELDGHHDVMLLDAQRLVDALLKLG